MVGISDRHRGGRRLLAAAVTTVTAYVLAAATGFAGDPAEKVFELNIVADAIPGATTPLRVDESDHITLIWTADRPTDVHLHGYDIKATVEPGQTATMSLTANATGRFPITAHGADGGHLTLQYLEVHPR